MLGEKTSLSRAAVEQLIGKFGQPHSALIFESTQPQYPTWQTWWFNALQYKLELKMAQLREGFNKLGKVCEFQEGEIAQVRQKKNLAEQAVLHAVERLAENIKAKSVDTASPKYKEEVAKAVRFAKALQSNTAILSKLERTQRDVERVLLEHEQLIVNIVAALNYNDINTIIYDMRRGATYDSVVMACIQQIDAFSDSADMDSGVAQANADMDAAMGAAAPTAVEANAVKLVTEMINARLQRDVVQNLPAPPEAQKNVMPRLGGAAA